MRRVSVFLCGVVAVLWAASPGVHAQPLRFEVVGVVEPDEPRATLDLGEQLVLALGRPWAEVAPELVAPDSGAVEGPSGRLLWRVPDYAVDGFRADVRGGTLAGVTLDFSADGPDFADYAERLRRRAGAAGRGGFYDADALGFPFDLAVWPDDNRLDFRAVPGRTVPAGTPLPVQLRSAAGPGPDASAVVEAPEEPPTIVGGLGALYARLDYPPDALAEGVGGTVTVQMVVGVDGTARGVVVLRSPDPRLGAAAAAAVGRTWFAPGRNGGVPVRSRFAVAVRFVPPASGGDG